MLQHVAWRPGFVRGDLLEVVELPVVGAFAPSSESGFSVTVGGARVYVISLSLAGLSMLVGGAVFWRRRRAG